MNFLPKRRPDLDDDAIQNIIDKLETEFILPANQRDAVTVQMCMDNTLSERRRMIVSELCTIKVLNETYPILFEADEWLREFQRLTKLDLMVDTRTNIAKFADTVFLFEGPAKAKAELDSLKRGILKIDETVRRPAQIDAALIALPLMLKDDAALLFREDSENDDVRTPRIITICKDRPSLLAANAFRVEVSSNIKRENTPFW